MKELTVAAKLEELNKVLEFVEAVLDEKECPMKARMQIAIAVEEIFVNIAHYAYRPIEGEATIRVCVNEAPLQVTIQFLDGGRPYNPLEKADPDTTLSAEEREIGGLGIFMVKKSMDSLTYDYQEGKNILTIRKTVAAQP